MENYAGDKKGSSLETIGAEKILETMPSFEEFRKNIEENEESEDVLSVGLRKIAEKFGYGEEVKTTLEKAVPAIAEHYNNQDAVLEVLRSCPIFMIGPNDRMSEEANEYLGRNEKLPTIASGAASIIPSVNQNGEVEVRKAIIIKNNGSGFSTLVHEICHQVASLGKEPQLCSDGRVRIDVGLASEFYEKSDNGEMELAESTNTNLEEMMNARDETLIMQKILGSEYKGSSYGTLRAIAGKCPPEVIEKLQKLRSQSNPSETIASQELLRQASENLDDIMDVPKRTRLSRESANGNEDKEKEIYHKLLLNSVNKAIENLTSWGKESQ